MKRNVLMFVGLSILALAATGCCSCGQHHQPVLGGYQQPVLPNVQQAQPGLGQFGRNLGNRFANGFLNRGVNHVINGAISGF